MSTNTSTAIAGLPGSYGTNYQLSGGGALLSTTSTAAAPNDIWSVSLFQDFTFDNPLNPGDQLQLQLDFSSVLSDAGLDFAFAQLEDLSALVLAPLDLSSGGLFDITMWAGRSVRISFGIQDSDDIADSLTIKNLNVANVPVSTVPLPGSALFLLSGLVALRRKLFQR